MYNVQSSTVRVPPYTRVSAQLAKQTLNGTVLEETQRTSRSVGIACPIPLPSHLRVSRSDASTACVTCVSFLDLFPRVQHLERGLGPAPKLGQSITEESPISKGSSSPGLTGPIRLYINCARGHKSMPLTIDDASGCFDHDSSKPVETSLWFVCWITCLFLLFTTCRNIDNSIIWHALTSSSDSPTSL